MSLTKGLFHLFYGFFLLFNFFLSFFFSFHSTVVVCFVFVLPSLSHCETKIDGRKTLHVTKCVGLLGWTESRGGFLDRHLQKIRRQIIEMNINFLFVSSV